MVFGFIKKVFVVAMSFFTCNVLKSVSMNNPECKIRPQIININSDNPIFYPYSIEMNKCTELVVVIISMVHTQNYVFLMLLKTLMSKCLI